MEEIHGIDLPSLMSFTGSGNNFMYFGSVILESTCSYNCLLDIPSLSYNNIQSLSFYYTYSLQSLSSLVLQF